MIHCFATYEEAGIYAGAMRSDGYYAAILDENMGFIYGPIAIGGFRVIVSDEPVEDQEPPAPAPSPVDDMLDAIRLMVAAVAGLGILILTLLFLFELLKQPDLLPGFLLVVLFLIAIPCAAICLLIPLWEPMTRALRDERSMFGICVRGLVVLHVAVNLLGPLFLMLYVICREADPYHRY